MALDLDKLVDPVRKAERDARGLPPVAQWNPPLSGDLDIRIARDGTWWHEGSPVRRIELARLFSSILKREGDAYFLVTPVEKWRIQVEDAPFLAPLVQRVPGADPPLLAFTTSLGTTVLADAGHPLRVETRADGEPAPYLRVRDDLEALVGRNAFYQLVEWAAEEEGVLVVRSGGVAFTLGRPD